MKYVKFDNLPKRLTDEQLEQVVQFLRDNGNVDFCLACRACGLNECNGGCELSGKTIVNFIIETHIGLAISIANKFRKSDKQELVAVALLSLTEAVNRFERLINNNISAYASSCISYGIRHYLKRSPLIRVQSDTFLKTKQTFKIDKLTPLVGKIHKVQLQVDVRATLEAVAQTKQKKIIADCMLKGGFKKGEIAKLCGVSNARISQLSTEIEEEFKVLWNKQG